MQTDLFGNKIIEKQDKEQESVVCIKCDIEQPVEHFSVMQSGEIKRTCKSCKSGHKSILKKLRRQNAYPDDDYVCPICKRSIEEMSKYGQLRMKSWVLDHCHKTNKFRGWLCLNCNTSLGRFEDDPQKLINAIEYLLKDPIPQPDIEINDQMEIKFDERK